MTTQNNFDDEKARIAGIAKNLVELLDNEGNNYQVDYFPEYFKPEESGTSDVFLVEWGTSGNRVKRLVKVNKPHELLTSPRQIRHVVERGYDTRNELQIALKIDHPGVVKLVDYFDSEACKKYGLLGPVVVQDYFPDSISLEELVKQNNYQATSGFFRKTVEFVLGSPSRKRLHQDIREILLQTARTLRDLHSGKGVINGSLIVHRDLKPSNILVRKDKNGLVAKLGDLGNASPLDCQKPGYNPTMGGHIVSDPNLMGIFSDEERTFTRDSDMYALMSSILFYARGKPLVVYNPDTGEARDVDTWQTLVGKDGKIDKEKHREVVRRGVKALPRELRWIAERALSLYENERYVNTGLFLYEVERALSNPYSTLKKVGVGLAAAGLLAAATVGYVLHKETKSNLETEVQKANIQTKFQKRNKAIDIWLQSEAFHNRAKDPENKNMIFYNANFEDKLESAELYGWMLMLHPFDYKDNKYYGDPRTAVAAYLDATVDRFPVKVFEALMQLNGIKDSAELQIRLKEHDKNLILDYDKLEPYLKDIDQDLYWKVWGVFHRYGSDRIEMFIQSDRTDGVDLQIDGAKKVYDLRQHRDIEIRDAYKKEREEYGKNPGVPSSGIVGDAYKIQADGKIKRELDRIEKEYQKALYDLGKRHTGGR